MEPDKIKRTSLDISERLLKKVRHAAVEEGRSFKAIVADALELYLKKPRKRGRAKR